MRCLLLSLLSLCLTSISFYSQATTLKVATLSPDGSSWMREMRQAGKDIMQATDGRVVFKFYPGGVMGDDKSVLRKIRIRQLHGLASPSGALANRAPASQIYNLSLTFQNFDEVDYVRSQMDDSTLKSFENSGFIPLGIAEGGFAYVMSKGPVRTPSDLRTFKAWVPHTDKVTLEVVQNMGISPIPLSIGDVLPSLQTGLINAVATSPAAALALQWHTQVTHLTKVPLLYFYGMIAVDQKAFNKLSPADQKTTRTIMGAAFDVLDKQNRKDNEAAFAALQTQGLEIIEPNPEELKQWWDLQPMMRKALMDNGNVPEQVINTFLQHLDTFRTQTQSTHALKQ